MTAIFACDAIATRGGLRLYPTRRLLCACGSAEFFAGGIDGETAFCFPCWRRRFGAEAAP